MFLWTSEVEIHSILCPYGSQSKHHVPRDPHVSAELLYHASRWLFLANSARLPCKCGCVSDFPFLLHGSLGFSLCEHTDWDTIYLPCILIYRRAKPFTFRFYFRVGFFFFSRRVLTILGSLFLLVNFKITVSSSFWIFFKMQ